MHESLCIFLNIQFRNTSMISNSFLSNTFVNWFAPRIHYRDYTYILSALSSSTPPGWISNSKRFPLVSAWVWYLLITRLRTIYSRSAAPPSTFPFVTFTAPPEGHIHQALAAASQLREGSSILAQQARLRVESQQVEKQRDRDLGITCCVRHLKYDM